MNDEKCWKMFFNPLFIYFFSFKICVVKFKKELGKDIQGKVCAVVDPDTNQDYVEIDFGGERKQ
jgi:hypothetical protein